MNTPIIFKTADNTYRVMQKKKYQTNFKLGYAYLLSEINSYVYPYRGEISDTKEALEVGIYTINGRVLLHFPSTKEEKIVYSKDNLIALSPDVIFKDLKEMVPDPYIEEDNNIDCDIFKPQIKSTDDIALAGMKYAIGQKNINFNQYAHKFSDAATKNNSRRLLTHGTSLKCEMASRFGEVFGINFGLIFWDKVGERYPTDPDYRTVYAIFDNEELDFNDPKYKFVTIERDV